MKKCVEIKDKFLLTVEEAAAISNIGVHKIREMSEWEDCTWALKKGANLLVKRTLFEKYLMEREVI